MQFPQGLGWDRELPEVEIPSAVPLGLSSEPGLPGRPSPAERSCSIS